MKKTLHLGVCPEHLSADDIAALAELEEKGFLINGLVVYDEEQKGTVFSIINRIKSIRIKL